MRFKFYPSGLLFIVSILLVCNQLAAQSFPGSTINISPTGTSTNSGTATVSGVGMVPNGADITVTLHFNHTWVSDLGVWLVAPGGQVLELMTVLGGANNNGNIIFSDAGVQNITTVAVTTSTGIGGCPPSSYAYNGTFRPEGRNAAVVFPPTVPSNVPAAGTFTFANQYSGINANGIWTLYMNDHAGGDGGATCNWSVNIVPQIAPCTPGAYQVFTNSTPVAIPTGPAVVTSTINVTGALLYLYDVNVLTNITHTFAADLDITIMSPAGTVVTLTTDNGGGNEDVFNGTIWDDDANPAGQVPYTTNDGLATDHAYVNLTLASPLVPEEALGAFIGENPNGVWTITVSDDAAGDGGSINWSLAISGLAAAPVTAPTSVTNSTPVPILDVATVTSTIFFGGAGTQLLDVNLTTFITHTFASDLDITLMSPAGTVVTLTTDNGGGNEDVFNGTVWDDDANPAGQVPYTTNNGVASDHAYVNLVTATPLVPEEAMAAFIGEDPNGTWTITISDDTGGDVGSLNSWTLSLTTSLCSPAPTCILTCPANIIVSNDPNQCGAFVTYPAPTTTGACGTVATSPASGSFFPVGTTTVTATSSLGGGTCSFTIRVNDTQPPTITCPANITVSNTPGQCGAVVTFIPTGTDNCPGLVITSVPASGSFFPVGTTTVNSTATDAAGNVSTCSFTITVNDTQPPVITCPANITTNNTPNRCDAVVNYSLPTVTDNCGSGTVSDFSNPWTNSGQRGVYFDITNLSASPVTITRLNPAIWGPAAFSNVYTVYFTTVANTWNGNQANAGAWTLNTNANVSFPGGANPVQVAVPLTTPITLAPGQSKGVFVVATLGYGGGPNAYLSTAAGYAGPQSYSDGTLRFTGGVGTDGLFGGNFFGTGAAGNFRLYYGSVSYFIPPPLVPVQIAGLASGSMFPVGVTTNTFRVTDASNNTSTCSFTVTVNDVQAPVITCPANITATTPIGSCTAVVTYNVTATDNCPGVTTALISGPASGSAFPLGPTTVTWRATDASNNTSTCSFTVTVLDGQLPVISIQPANTSACVASNAIFSVTAAPLGGPNNLTYQWQTYNGTIWVNVPGATSATLTISNVTMAMSTNTYRVIVNGLCTSVTSGQASLTVRTLPVISLSTSRSPILIPGQYVNITASPGPPGGTIAWYRNGVLMPSEVSLALSNLSVDNTGTYHAFYTAPNGCSVTSGTVTVSVASSNNLFVYPNPSDGDFQVRIFAQNQALVLTVYDTKGSRVYQRSVTTGSAPYSRVDVMLPTVAAGFYSLDVRDASGKQIGKKQLFIWR